ncbi:MAG: helix-turn-helix domain-containing protein [Firmicutes bacterium]|nr:helix-turn-helix domain-containing protein [Bacillota bacterium]
MKIFAERLRKLREEKSLSIRRFASILGIAGASYIRYENNTSEPTQEMLIKIARYFDVTVGYLLGEEDY